MLAGLINELSVQPDDLTLILDDYHLADGSAVQSGMTLLVERLPPQVHLVISTRVDPALPIARLRARGELVEIRAADLRFTDGEASVFLSDLGLALSPGDQAALGARTEGWAAALQLAALSLQGCADPSGFIAGFAGDDRFVVDYLAEEVLDRQPAHVRRFLLDTSILGGLTGELCDAVGDRSDGKAMLEALERANLFVVPLDDTRRWYRYHHLFAEVLRAHLVDERPEAVAELHRRASAWYASAGGPEAAVRHALAAGDADRAADLVELAIPGLRRQRREDVIRHWASELPGEVLANRPVLAVGLIGGLAASNEFNDLDRRLCQVEQDLARPPEQLVIHDWPEFARLPGLIETYRSALALVHGDTKATVAHAEAAHGLAADDDHLTIAAASALAGLAAWTEGDIHVAHRSYALAADELAQAGYVADVLGCTVTLVDLELTRGRLGAAQRAADDALRLAEIEGRGPGPVRGTADMYVALARVAWERGEIDTAAAQLDHAARLGEGAGLPQNPYRWRVAMAALRDGQGDPAAAAGLLAEAERVYVGDFSPNVRPVAATRARLAAARGDLAGARAWLASVSLGLDNDPIYRHEYELVTVARVLLAEHASTGSPSLVAEATGLLNRVLVAAEAGARTGSVIEILVVSALALQAAGEQGQALSSLERAVRLAESEGWVRVFTAEGSHLTGLLRTLAAQRPGWAFARRLRGNAAPVYGIPTRQPLIDPLSERELDVLRLLASELDGPAIARQLSVSLATVRTHTQRIYTKLGVNNRRGAVSLAHQLNLFGHERHR